MQSPPIRRALLASAAPFILCLPLVAQDPQTDPDVSEAAAEDVVTFEVPVTYENLDALGNEWAPDRPMVTTRGAGDLADKVLIKWSDVLLQKFDTFVQPIDGSSNPRESALTLINALVGSSMLGAAGTTLGGAGGGALIGGVITSESGGWGAAPGLALGGGAGMAVGSAQIAGTVIAALLLTDEIEKRYPYENGGVRRRGLDEDEADIAVDDDLWADPPEWLAEEIAAATADRSADSGAADAVEEGDEEGVAEASDEVDTRGLDGRKGRTRTSRTATARTNTARVARSSRGRAPTGYAGPQESMFIHLVGELIGPRVRDLARHWDRMPGLPPAVRAQLQRSEKPLRDWVRRIDYVRTNKRLSPDSPKAMPLSAWQKAALQTLSGGANTGVWLDAFAIGRTKISVDGKNVSWTTPRALREFGAPSKFTANVGNLYAKVNGFGGSLSAKIEPGDFDLSLGSARIENNRIEVGFSVRSGKRIASVSVKGKLGNIERTLFSFKPKLRKTFSGSVRFKLSNNGGLSLDSVRLGNLDLSLGMGKIDNPMLAPLDGLRKSLEKKIVSELSKLLGEHMGWSSLFRNLGNYAPKNLLAILNKSATDLGLSSIESLHGIAIRNGQLELKVRCTSWNGAPTVEHRKYAAHLRRLFR